MVFSDYFFMPLEELKNEDLVEVERCGCCGASASFKPLGLFREQPRIQFVRCNRCRAVTYDRMISPEKLDEIYEAYSYFNEDQQTKEKDQITFNGKQRFAAHLCGLLKNFPYRERLRILDFGGGDGALAASCAQMLMDKGLCQEAQIVVVDYVEDATQAGPGITVDHVFPLDQVPAEDPFDLVIASAVLEHLPQPGPVFRQLVRRTGRGGYLYFRTPYRYPLYRLLRRIGVTLDMRYPRHIWDLGEDWWKRILSCLRLQEEVVTVVSQPSVAEKSFHEHFFIALASRMLKLPRRLLVFWPYVGGWEVLMKKKNF